MAICTVSQRKIRRPYIGSMNKRIEIKRRSITPVNVDSSDFLEQFNGVITIWASCETVSNVTEFDGTNTERSVTHKWIIRYVDGVTSESWIKFQGKYYDVINIMDYEERHRFLVLTTAIRGDASLPTNFA